MWLIYPLLTFNLHVFSKESPWDSKIENIYSQMRTENRTAQVKARETKSFDLKLLTINLGLLNIPLVSVPYYDDRANLFPVVMKDFIQHKRPGILFIQELWNKKDFEALNKIASSLDYIPLISYNYKNIEKRGLQILIDRKIVQEEYVHSGFWQYMQEEKPIRSWGEELLNYEPGLLYAQITLIDGKKILLGNTHLTPGVGEKIVRRKQLQSLMNHLKSNSNSSDYIFLGGGFNLSPDLNSDESGIDEWYFNQYLYLYFYTEMNKNDFYLLDTYKTVRDDMGFTQAHENPIATMGTSTKHEPEQRQDFIWASTVKKDSSMNLAIIYSRLVFNKPITAKKDPKDPKGEDIQIYLSDHFGVLSTISLFNE